jgi:putative ABC transport system permease protein
MLAKRPGFTLIAALALALGIGANSAIFTVVNAVLLRPLPYPQADRLVWIWGTNPANNVPEETASAPDYADWKKFSQSFDQMGAFARTSVILTGEGEPERALGGLVTDGFFSVLGTEAKLGRTFTPEEDLPKAQPVAILSEGLWQRKFGSDPQIIGKSIIINGNSTTIVGVLSADFRNPRPDAPHSDLWMPFRLDYAQANRRSDYLGVIARLKPGVSIEQSRAEMDQIAASLSNQYPNTNAGWGVKVIPLHERFVGNVRLNVLFLMIAVALLLMIACANVANLLLARAAARRKEIAIRAALGARRGRVIRQLLTESVMLSLVGGAAGLGLAAWGVDVLISFSPADLPRLDSIGLDARVVVFTLAVSILTGILFGLAPAIQSSSTKLGECLKEGGRDSLESGGSILRNTLAAAEIAIALLLLIGAGLMARSFAELQKVDPGFSDKEVLTSQIQLPRTRYKEGPQVSAFYNQLLERISTLPGMQACALISDPPMSGNSNAIAFAVEGRPPLPPDQFQDAEAYTASEDYFRVMNIPVKRGRAFTSEDRADGPLSMVINETFARRYFPGEDPLSHRITLNNPQQGPWAQIVGIVGDVRHDGMGAEPYPQMYSATSQSPPRGATLVMKTEADPSSLISAVRSEIRNIDAGLPLYNIRPMEQLTRESMARPRFNTFLIALFAALALLLASVGIYGVMSYSVTQRTHEIGVRMALGAASTDITRMIVWHGLKVSLAGVTVGLGASFALTWLMKSLLYGVSATDPLTFAAIAALLTLVAMVACYIPARRATRVDPMIALRYE